MTGFFILFNRAKNNFYEVCSVKHLMLKIFMKLFFRFLATALLIITGLTVLGYFFWHKPKLRANSGSHPYTVNNKDNDVVFLRLKQKAVQLKSFADAHHFNTTRCFLIDMKITSGQKRFFVFNLLKDSIENSGLVTHGTGSDKGTAELFFSNTPNSNCTSVGKYKIGKPYMGKFGLAYKLYGLDETNSNAFERFVVLHAHSCVPNEAVAPLSICESWGCPTIAPAFLAELKAIIDQSSRPVLLWIYY